MMMMIKPTTLLILTLYSGAQLASSSLAFSSVQQRLSAAPKRGAETQTKRPSATTKTALHVIVATDCARGGGGVSGGKTKKDATNLLQKYSALVDEKPLLTKAATAGIVAALADLFSQAFVLKQPAMSFQRATAFLLTGALFVGPYLHFWYDQLNNIAKQQSHSVRTLSKMLLDQTVGVSIFFPLYFTAYELADSLMTGRGKRYRRFAVDCSNRFWMIAFDFSYFGCVLPLSHTHHEFPTVPVLRHAVEKCRVDMMSIVLMNWRIWPLANIINFGLVPPQLQVLVNQTLSFFWCVYLSTRID